MAFLHDNADSQSTHSFSLNSSVASRVVPDAALDMEQFPEINRGGSRPEPPQIESPPHSNPHLLFVGDPELSQVVGPLFSTQNAPFAGTEAVLTNEDFSADPSVAKSCAESLGPGRDETSSLMADSAACYMQVPAPTKVSTQSNGFDHAAKSSFQEFLGKGKDLIRKGLPSPNVLKIRCIVVACALVIAVLFAMNKRIVNSQEQLLRAREDLKADISNLEAKTEKLVASLRSDLAEEADVEVQIKQAVELKAEEADVEARIAQAANDARNDTLMARVDASSRVEALEAKMDKLFTFLRADWKPECRFSNPKECGCKNVHQKDYRETLSVTQSGRECQRWDKQYPHSHSWTPGNYPHAGLTNNYCRNPDPDNDYRAWCFTTDPDRRAEYCSVPFCSEDTENNLFDHM